MIQKAFNTVSYLNKHLENKIIEISVKQSQIMFSFENAEYLSQQDMGDLCDLVYPFSFTDIVCFNNMLYLCFRDFDDESKIEEAKGLNQDIYYLRQIIDILKTVLCSCPMLEFVVSEAYLKIYLDLNNIQLSSLIFLLEQWNYDPFLELGADRPYLLYINESDIND